MDCQLHDRLEAEHSAAVAKLRTAEDQRQFAWTEIQREMSRVHLARLREHVDWTRFQMESHAIEHRCKGPSVEPVSQDQHSPGEWTLA